MLATGEIPPREEGAFSEKLAENAKEGKFSDIKTKSLFPLPKKIHIEKLEG